jgi:dUTP pyrophosphatase
MSRSVKVGVRRLEHGKGLPLPQRATPGAAGFDLCAAVGQKVLLEPGKRLAIPTGLAFEIPSGWEGQVRPRSGLARRYGVTVVNAPGTVDSDYRGEILILLVNLGEEICPIEPGERIAQIVFAPVATEVEWQEAEELAPSQRGEQGFGSTGRR